MCSGEGYLFTCVPVWRPSYFADYLHLDRGELIKDGLASNYIRSQNKKASPEITYFVVVQKFS